MSESGIVGGGYAPSVRAKRLSNRSIHENTNAETPYTITGPAILNMLVPTPNMKPSAAVNVGHISL